jgi:nitroimidazol reductase NimA-like FMN-containing flavoprotein (pyridoxamine 5'-phosphate oxidase superfamily)
VRHLPPQLVELTREDSLCRLAEATYGRIVFTEKAMPAIRPINHIVADGTVIVRTRLGNRPLGPRGVVVAYEADDIDPVEHRGWSVIVTGLAAPVQDSDEVTRFEQLLRPWVNGCPDNEIIRIEPRFVTGYQLD